MVCGRKNPCAEVRSFLPSQAGRTGLAALYQVEWAKTCAPSLTSQWKTQMRKRWTKRSQDAVKDKEVLTPPKVVRQEVEEIPNGSRKSAAYEGSADDEGVRSASTLGGRKMSGNCCRFAVVRSPSLLDVFVRCATVSDTAVVVTMYSLVQFSG